MIATPLLPPAGATRSLPSPADVGASAAAGRTGGSGKRGPWLHRDRDQARRRWAYSRPMWPIAAGRSARWPSLIVHPLPAEQKLDGSGLIGVGGRNPSHGRSRGQVATRIPSQATRPGREAVNLVIALRPNGTVARSRGPHVDEARADWRRRSHLVRSIRRTARLTRMTDHHQHRGRCQGRRPPVDFVVSPDPRRHRPRRMSDLFERECRAAGRACRLAGAPCFLYRNVLRPSRRPAGHPPVPRTPNTDRAAQASPLRRRSPWPTSP